jgi:hypothetical protein
MPTATSERIRSRQERLDATMRESLEAIRQNLLKHGGDMLAVQREAERDLRDLLREGVERGALLDAVTTMRPHAERVVELAIFEGDAAFVAQLREAQDFLDWLRSLEQSASTPFPPFEDSQLPPPPAGPTAEGYVSISEARARVQTGKKP